MIANVVPIVRLRRATTWWSYRVPGHTKLTAGSLVTVPLRGKIVPGIVWSLEEGSNLEAKDSISEVIVADPIFRQPTRNHLEWLAESTCTSLSTIAYLTLPSLLRNWPYRKSTLQNLGRWQPTLTSARQRIFLLPSERKDVIDTLRQSDPNLISWFDIKTELQELAYWLMIAAGSVKTIIGREKALFSSFSNLTACIIQDPEDVSYYHEQTPYISMVEVAYSLAKQWGAESSTRSSLPEAIQAELWPGSEHYVAPLESKLITIHELQKKEIINDELVQLITQTVSQNKEVIILYNAKDKYRVTENDPRPLLVPGIETLRTKLALRIPSTKDLSRIHFDTRTVFKRRYNNVGLTIALNIDPVLYQQNFADELHGWSDLYKLQSYAAPLVVQTFSPTHPALLALRENRLTTHLLERITERKNLELPPFCTTVVCSLPVSEQSELLLASLADLLREQGSEKWRISAPTSRKRRTTQVHMLSLHASLGTLLPDGVHKKLASLPRPWKVERNPWYAL